MKIPFKYASVRAAVSCSVTRSQPEMTKCFSAGVIVRGKTQPNLQSRLHSQHSPPPSQVPKTTVNHDVGVRRWNLWISYLLTQGSRDWGVSQISTSRILHSGPNLRWTGFLYQTFTLISPYMVNTNKNKHKIILIFVQIFLKLSNMTKIKGEIWSKIVI